MLICYCTCRCFSDSVASTVTWVMYAARAGLLAWLQVDEARGAYVSGEVLVQLLCEALLALLALQL